jgi:hypothetical protein
VFTDGPGGPGTGATVDLVPATKGSQSNVLATYTVVIYGDVNGDSNVDSQDAGVIADKENYLFEWDVVTDACYLTAGDLNADGNVDSVDSGIVVDYENYLFTINQTTGLAESF